MRHRRRLRQPACIVRHSHAFNYGPSDSNYSSVNYANSIPVLDTDTNSKRHAVKHSDADNSAISYAHENADADQSAYTYIYAVSYADYYTDTDKYADSNYYTNSDKYADAYTDKYADSDPRSAWSTYTYPNYGADRRI